MTKFDSILKSRYITLPIKICLVKAMVFPVVMYGCECWIIKRAECWRIDAFELLCWRRLLRVPWMARSNQSILKEISPEYSLKGLMLKLQYFGHVMQRTDLLQKTLMLGKMESREERDDRGWVGLIDGITDSMGMSLSNLLELKMVRKLSPNHGNSSCSSIQKKKKQRWWTVNPGILQSMGLQRVRHNWATELTEHTFQLWQAKISSDLSGVSGGWELSHVKNHYNWLIFWCSIYQKIVPLLFSPIVLLLLPQAF